MKKILSFAAAAIMLLSGCSAAPDNTKGNTVEAATAQEFVEGMGQGWNLGNTLDPENCTWVSNEMDYETAWGNPRVTRELIAYIKAQGFDTIRIPVSWHNHMDENYNISEQWIARVQEVIDWCVEEDFYIILNIHHEGEWLTKASTDYEGVMTQYKAIWTQLADRFGDYSNKLIFESMNEIGFDDLGTEKGCELISKINAEFTTLIRNSGKNNADRYLLLAGYWTDIDRTCTPEYTLPDDEKIILSVHYYSPSTFAIADKTSTWGYQETWGTDEDYVYLKGQFEKLKTGFIDKGIPVIIGEYGATIKDKDNASRIAWFKAVTETSLEYKCCPIVWDAGDVISRADLCWKTDGLYEAVFGENAVDATAAA